MGAWVCVSECTCACVYVHASSLITSPCLAFPRSSSLPFSPLSCYLLAPVSFPLACFRSPSLASPVPYYPLPIPSLPFSSLHVTNLLFHVQSSSSYHHGYTLTSTRTHARTDSTHTPTLTCVPIRACARANARIRTCMHTASLVDLVLHTLSHLPFQTHTHTAHAHGPRCGLTQGHDTPPGAGV